MEKITICVFGDSITWGKGDAEKGGWCDELKRHFCLDKDRDIRLYNLGISADNTDRLIKRFKTEAEARQPQIIVFAIGINDSQYVGSKDNPRVPLSRFESNIIRLIKEAREFTQKILFIGPTHVDETITKPLLWEKEKFYDNETIGEYNEALQRVCTEERLAFLDLTGLLDDADLDDGLHPNSEGYTKMLEKIRPFILEKGF